MKLLLLYLGLSLIYAHKEERHHVVKSNFDMSKIEGNWFSILLASDKREHIEENGDMRVFVEYTQVLANSSLIYKFYVKTNGECTAVTLVCDKTEEDGIYSAAYNGNNTFYIIETDYDTYIIYILTNFNYGREFKLMELFGREPDVSKNLKRRFERLCRKHGIVKENIIDLTKIDRCLEARNEGDAPASRLVISNPGEDGVAQEPVPSEGIGGLCPKLQ